MFKAKIQIILSLVLIFNLIFSNLVVFAYDESLVELPKILINEIQTGGINDVDEEFIELKNIGDTKVDIGGWGLQSISSTGNLGTAKIFTTFTKGTVIDVNGFLLVAPADYFASVASRTDYTLKSFDGLSSTGGTVSLVNDSDKNGAITDDEIIDRVGWGTDTVIFCEAELASIPKKGESIQRQLDDFGLPVDTDNNKNDFWPSGPHTPGVPNLGPNPLSPEDPEDPVLPTPTVEPNVGPTEEPVIEPTPTPEPAMQLFLPILLSELFINPASPLTDTNDEWVEVYNPNSEPIDLGGYVIFTGATFNYHYIFPDDLTLEPHTYITITSGQSSLSLSNAGGAAKVAGPDGTVYDQTTYNKAEESNAWAKDNTGKWQWTSTPTKDMANLITALPLTIKKAAASIKKAVKSTSKKATPKKSTTKTTKVKSASTTNIVDENPDLISAPTPLPTSLLAGLGLLAVLYALYEYRFDVANKIYQFKLYRRNRR